MLEKGWVSHRRKLHLLKRELKGRIGLCSSILSRGLQACQGAEMTISLQFLSLNKCMTIISAYAPTRSNVGERNVL